MIQARPPITQKKHQERSNLSQTKIKAEVITNDMTYGLGIQVFKLSSTQGNQHINKEQRIQKVQFFSQIQFFHQAQQTISPAVSQKSQKTTTSTRSYSQQQKPQLGALPPKQVAQQRLQVKAKLFKLDGFENSQSNKDLIEQEAQNQIQSPRTMKGKQQEQKQPLYSKQQIQPPQPQAQEETSLIQEDIKQEEENHLSMIENLDSQYEKYDQQGNAFQVIDGVKFYYPVNSQQNSVTHKTNESVVTTKDQKKMKPIKHIQLGRKMEDLKQTQNSPPQQINSPSSSQKAPPIQNVTSPKAQDLENFMLDGKVEGYAMDQSQSFAYGFGFNLTDYIGNKDHIKNFESRDLLDELNQETEKKYDYFDYHPKDGSEGVYINSVNYQNWVQQQKILQQQLEQEQAQQLQQESNPKTLVSRHSQAYPNQQRISQQTKRNEKKDISKPFK